MAPSSAKDDTAQIGTRVRYFGDYELLEEIAAYFREVRKKYAKFEGALKGVDSRIAAYYCFPDNGRKNPAFVWCHGGAQSAHRSRGKGFAAQGFATVDINWLGRPLEVELDPLTLGAVEDRVRLLIGEVLPWCVQAEPVVCCHSLVEVPPPGILKRREHPDGAVVKGESLVGHQQIRADLGLGAQALA